MATHLQDRGLAPFTPVNRWLLERPEEITRAHQDYLEAGAQVLVTATFRTLPHLDPEWAIAARQAIQCAKEAGPAQVWLSVGPLSTVEAPWSTLSASERERHSGGWSDLVALAAPDIDGVLLESFIHLDACLAAIEKIRPVWSGPITASLSPGPDGTLFDGTAIGPSFDALLAAGATHVGLNCGSSVDDVLRAVATCSHDQLWIRPGTVHAGANDLIHVLDRIGDRCALLGGCCGYGPAHIRSLKTAR